MTSIIDKVNRFKAENCKNGSVFARLSSEEDMDRAQSKIDEMTNGQCYHDTEFIHVKDPYYSWLNMHYDIVNLPYTNSHVPDSIKKYFNNSENRKDYRMGGDAVLEIFYFPKEIFPTFESFVRHLEKTYLTYLYKDYQCDEYVFDRKEFSLSDRSETIITVRDLYCVSVSCFYGFNNIMDSTSNVNLFDFLPEGQGYDGKPQVRFRLLMKADGNDFILLLETDSGWIYWHSETT